MSDSIGEGRALRAAQACEETRPGGAPLARRSVVAALAGAATALMAPGVASAQGFVLPMGPRTTHIVVSKSNRVMELRSAGKVIKKYKIELGFQPEGHKVSSGDGRTPEGRYWIDRRNPRSEFYLSLGINYPNAEDMARAAALGVDPGGDIFIHGEPVRMAKRSRDDWTAGCIAVKNREIEEIWALTPIGVPITIFA